MRAPFIAQSSSTQLLHARLWCGAKGREGRRRGRDGGSRRRDRPGPSARCVSCLCSLVSGRAQHCSGTPLPDAGAASPASAFSYAVGKYRGRRGRPSSVVHGSVQGGRIVAPALPVGSRGLGAAGPALRVLCGASLGRGASVRSVAGGRGLERGSRAAKEVCSCPAP